MKRSIFVLVWILLLLGSCTDKEPGDNDEDLTLVPYNPESYELILPVQFPAMQIPEDNPMTVDGVALGRRLFYDTILSSDGSMSCSSCHLPNGNFTDNQKFSTGVTGELSSRSSMTLLNVGFANTGLFWDGRVSTLEEQALLPVEDPIELHESWPNVEVKLRDDENYPTLFRKAFGIETKMEISKELTVKAIAQFERSLISSGNSKYDRVIAGLDVFSDQELRGHDIFFDIDPDQSKHAECGHCHNAPLFTTNEYLNNGLDSVDDLLSFKDQGRGKVTGVLFDNGAFKVPTLRNIINSAPYMHDGRFNTLDEVIDHYETGGHIADNIGAVMRPLILSESDRQALIAFIATLQDDDFLNNPEFSNPF